jgi:hypothetical protein
MASYSIQGNAIGNESVYDYTRRRWSELRDNLKTGKFPAVTNDAAGAYAASKLIFVELKKNPGAVTDALPPEASYIESIITNPLNPIAWVVQKAGQAVEAATHSVKVNLDKPAEALSSVGKALPWYTKPGAIVGILAATIILPPLFGKSFEGLLKGLKTRKKSRRA